MVVWVWTVTVVEALLCTLLANDVSHNGGIVGLRRCREIKDHYMVVVVVGLSVVRCMERFIVLFTCSHIHVGCGRSRLAVVASAAKAGRPHDSGQRGKAADKMVIIIIEVGMIVICQ